MAISERLALLVTLDANGAVKSFNDLGKAADKNLSKADSRMDKMASRFQKAGAGMLASAGLLGAGLYKAGQSAAELEQAVGGTEAVFGEASAAIDDYAKKAARAAGLSESAFRTATTSIGGQLKGLGFSTEEAADQAVKLTQVAADLSATYGGTTAEAVQALGAAFRGEADPAERFNLFLNQTRVNAKAVELGLASSTSQVDANAKAQAVLALVTEQSADAQGQFARETGTAAGQMAIANAEFENAKASLGQSIAPILADVAGGLADVAGGFTRANEASGGFLSKAAAVGTAGLAVAGGLSFTVGKVIDMRENLGKLSGPLKNTEGGLNRVGKGLVGLGLVGTVAGLAAMANEMSQTKINVEGLATALGDLNSKNREQAEQTVIAAAAMGELDTTVARLAESNPVAADRFVALAESMGVTGDQLKELKGIVDDKRTSDVQAAEDQQQYAAEVQGAVKPVKTLTTEIEDQKSALDLATESTNKFKEGLEDAFKDLTIEEAADRRTQAFVDMADRFAEAQANVKTAKQRVADLLATPSEDRGATFERDLADAQRDVREAIDETSRALEGNSEAALQNREDIRGAVEDVAALIEKHREEGASLDDLQYIRGVERENLRRQLEQLGFNRDEIDKYVAAIDNIPLTKATTLTLDTAVAMTQYNNWRDAVLGDINAVFNPFGSGGEAPRRAIGGPVTAGERYGVNEYLGAGKGFEWFAPANGTISPAGSTTRGTTSQINNIVINNPTQEPANTSIRKVRSELAVA